MEQIPVETAERKAFYERIDKENMTALWTVMAARMAAKRQAAGTQALLGSGVISAPITVHRAVMFSLSMRS